MNVQLAQGDLLDQDVDVIVNAWNRNIIPWWLLLAHEKGFQSIAFPLIGAGAGGFNQERARAIMEDELGKMEYPLGGEAGGVSTWRLNTTEGLGQECNGAEKSFGVNERRS